MRILVTGAAGFIGRRLVYELVSDGHIVIGTDICDKPAEFPRDMGWIKGELQNLDYSVGFFKELDVCFHLAWGGNSGDGRGDYQLQIANVSNSIKLVNELSKCCKRFVGVGTLAEYDIESYLPQDGSKPNITSEYAIAKMSAYYFTKAECNKLGIEHIWCRLSNTYGEGNTTNNFINFASKIMLAGKRASFTEGNQLYDFMYVTDTVCALKMAGIMGKDNSSYYLGSGKPRQLKEYIKILRDSINPEIELFLGEIPFNGVSLPLEKYDTSKLKNDTGFVTLVEFEVGIQRTINWMKGNM